MCDQPHYDKLRDRVSLLERNDTAQTEQIKTLFNATREMKDSLNATFSKVLWAFVALLVLAVLAIIYGAIGDKGFRAVTATTPKIAACAARTPYRLAA